MIQRELQNPLAQMILEGRVPDGATVQITQREGKLAIEPKLEAAEAA